MAKSAITLKFQAAVFDRIEYCANERINQRKIIHELKLSTEYRVLGTELLRESVRLRHRPNRQRVIDINAPRLERLAVQFEQCLVLNFGF